MKRDATNAWIRIGACVVLALLAPKWAVSSLDRRDYEVRSGGPVYAIGARGRGIVKYWIGSWLPLTRAFRNGVALHWERYYGKRGHERVPVAWVLKGKAHEKRAEFEIDFAPLESNEGELEQIK